MKPGRRSAPHVGRFVWAAAVLALACAVVGTGVAWGDSRVYAPRHRTAEELLPLAAAMLGERGRALIDAGNLVLIAPAKALEETTALLELRDAPRETLVIDVESRSLRSLRSGGRSVRWRGSTGSLRTGMLVEPPTGNALVDRGGRSISTARDDGSRFSVRVLDGESARLEIGQLEVFRDRSWFERYTTFLEIESGLVVRPRTLGNGDIQLQLEWQESGTEPEARVGFARLATTLRVEPGQTVVLGTVLRRGPDASLTRGTSRSGPSQESLLLLLRASRE